MPDFNAADARVWRRRLALPLAASLLLGCPGPNAALKRDDTGGTASTGGSGSRPSAQQPAGQNPGTTTPGGGQATTPTGPGRTARPRTGDGGASFGGPADGASHKGELTQYQALANVKPQAVSAATGGTFKSEDGSLTVVIPPNALNGDGKLRIRPIDVSERPITPGKVPGMSFWMDLGGANLGVDQRLTVSGPVPDKMVEELRRKDPNFDANKYSLRQENGKWMLTMTIEGPQSKPFEPTKAETPFFLTVDTADPGFMPITYFNSDGPVTNTGFKLAGAEGDDHLDGFETFDDVNIAAINEWIDDPNELDRNGHKRWELIDTKRVKTRDANGRIIELDAGSVGPDGKWRVATGTQTFNPNTHQQNCDFADAGCPDSGAVAQVLARFNHIVSTRFPDDYRYPTNLVDGAGNPDPRAGQPHPAAGKQKRPPDSMMTIVDRYRELGNACDNTGKVRVCAQALWKSDIAGIHQQIARGTNIAFKGLGGQAGGEVTLENRVRPVDDNGITFETLKGLYIIQGYYFDRRHVPSGLIAGGSEQGLTDEKRDYCGSNPVKVYIPRYSPQMSFKLRAQNGEFQFKNDDQVELFYKVGNNPAEKALEIVPPREGDPSALPTGKIPQILIGNAEGTETKAIRFFAKVGQSFNFPPGQDPPLNFEVVSVKVFRIEDGQRKELLLRPDDDSIARAKFKADPNRPGSGIWINGHHQFVIDMVFADVK